MPKVSVIVPNYNHANFLKQRLESIFNQTFQDFEVILLDDCSTDNSLKILKQYTNHPKVSHFIVNKKNSGSPFKQWKNGLDLAKGEFIWIAESDDWAENIFLERCLGILNDYLAVGIVATHSKIIDYYGNITNSTKNWFRLTNVLNNQLYFENGKKFVLNHMLDKNCLPNASSILFRRAALGKQSSYVEMKQAGDRLFWIDILLNNDICYIQNELNYFRRHKSTVTEINFKQKYSIPIIENIRIVEQINNSLLGFLSTSDLEKVKKSIAKRWFVLKQQSFFKKYILNKQDFIVSKYCLRKNKNIVFFFLIFLLKNFIVKVKIKLLLKNKKIGGAISLPGDT